MSEQWRSIFGYEGRYEISDLGRVKSYVRTHNGIILRPTHIPNRYPTVPLSMNGVVSRRTVHSLVLETFVGPRPDDHVIRHLNGDRHDPRLVNLSYGTMSENAFDTVRHGRNAKANQDACSKGHPFDADNTFWRSTGGRTCKTCRRAVDARRRKVFRESHGIDRGTDWYRKKASG